MDIRKLLQTGETETVEFKTTFGKEVIVSLSAFANTAGGKVVVGVDNARRPTGLQVGPESEQRYINEIKTATYPQIIPHVTSFEMDGRTVIRCKISEMGDYFRVELVQSQSKRSEKLPEKLPDLQKAIVLQMRSDPKATYDQLAKTTKKSREAIRKNIRRLKELGIIKRIGQDKGGHWQVTLTEK